MKVALVTGASGCGKTFVADQLRGDIDCLSYDRLMRDSIDATFPDHVGDKWDKQVWLDNGHRINLLVAFEAAFGWPGRRPLLVEGWQLRERVWRQAILDLATARVQDPLTVRLFVIQPTLELLLSLRTQSQYEYHRRHATVADCQRQIAIHEQAYREQPWEGELVQLGTKEETVTAVRACLSAT